MMKKYIVKLNGKEYEVEIEEVTREANEAAVTGMPKAPVIPEVAKPAAPTPATLPVNGGNAIKSPMPGAIIEIKVKAGSPVRKGDVLIVLESMKMMNEIVASEAGKIASVSVNKGDMVSAGDVLVTFV